MNDSLQILPLILHASLVVKGVMALLILLSVISWLIIFRLSAKMSGSLREDNEFQDWFWQNAHFDNLYKSLVADNDKTGLAQVFVAGYGEYQKLYKTLKNKGESPDNNALLDASERKLRVALGRQQAYLESGLPTLASIASVSPYIGLFGTVWGIMTAFIGLGQAQSVSLATVAPGIAEALIATAIGLFTAIPASLAFNHFTAKAGTLYEARALFCDELIGAILTTRLSTQGG